MKPRACLSCYHRKIKCDRQQPCTNCIDSSEVCSFPAGKIRRNRPTRKVVEALPTEQGLDSSNTRQVKIDNPVSASSTVGEDEYMVVDSASQSRLLASNAWANIREEEESLKETLLGIPQGNGSAVAPERFLFNASQSRELGCWVPNSAQLEACWRIYVADIDPLVRILHKPSIRKIFDDVQQTNLSLIDTTSLTLVFAVCFSAIISLADVQCRLEFGEDSQSLIERCKISVQNALIQAQLIASHNLHVLQAFVLFITCMPRDGSRTAWTLTGVAIRIATSLGLHRDGSHFPSLSPFEVEMRRRLWWHIRVLDIRASEDVGTSITGLIHSDTAFPGNLNDSDLNPASKIPLTVRIGVTEMSYSLFCFDSLKVFEKISPSTNTTIEEKRKTIDEFAVYVEQNYLKGFEANQSAPIFQLAIKMVQILISKMRIQTYFSTLRCRKPLEINAALSSSTYLEDIFSSAVSILEYQSQAVSNENLKGFRWLLGAYRQMHAMGFVLSQLKVRIEALRRSSLNGYLPVPLPSPIQRAWNSVEAVFIEYDKDSRSRPSWGPLLSLKRKIELKLEADNYALMQNAEYDHDWTGWDSQNLSDLEFFENIGTWQNLPTTGIGFEILNGSSLI